MKPLTITTGATLYRADGTPVRIESIDDGRIRWSAPSRLPWNKAAGRRAYGETAFDAAPRFLFAKLPRRRPAPARRAA